MTISRVRFRHLVASLLGTIVLILAIGETRASAVGYQVWSCSPRISNNVTGSGADWFSPGQGWFNNHCPDGLEFPGGATLDTQFSSYHWQWSGYVGDAVLSQLTLTMKGGSTTGGLVYEVVDQSTGDAFATLPARADGAADRTTTVDVPADVRSITLRARCAATTCTGSARLLINDIKFGIDDSIAPTALITDPYLGQTPDVADWRLPWFRADSMPIDFVIVERGSGLADATLKMDGPGTPFASELLWRQQNDCVSGWEFLNDIPPTIAYEREDICIGDVEDPSVINLRGAAEGKHKLTLEATDAMGLSSEPVVGWFGIDETPPEAPQNLSFINTTINANGWTRSPLFAAYDNPRAVYGPDEAPLGEPQGRITRDDAPGTPRAVDLSGNLQPFPSEGHFRVEGWYEDRAGNRGHSTPIYVGYDATKPPPPQLSENDWISRDQLLNGYMQEWTHLVPPSNVESKICGFIVAYDAEPIHPLSGEPTISGNVDAAPVPANLPEGNKFSHVASVSCAGLVSDTVNTPLRIDGTAPQLEIDGLPAGEWSSKPLSLTLQPSDDLSGVASVDWSLDGGPVQKSGGPVSVEIPDGQHLLTASATDNAGNVSASNSIVVQVDSAAPVSWLGPAGGRPNDFIAYSQDQASGLDSAVLQYRRVDAAATAGERVWRQAGAAYLPSYTATGPHAFTRELDDSKLADGAYELRVFAVDRAGNIGSGSTLPPGGTVTVNLPLRVRPIVDLAVADRVRRCSSVKKRGCVTRTRCRKRARCTFRWVTTKKGAGIDRIVNWGDRQALTGAVLSPSGAPLGGIKVSIYSTPRAGGRELVGALTTGADGRFNWRIPKGPSRSFTVATEATDSLAVAETTATLAVRAGLSFTASDRTPRPGQRVLLSGRLASGGLGVPSGGKKITFEYWRVDEWVPTIGAPSTDGAGRFKKTWRIPRSATNGTVFLRAHAESQSTETAWPFEAGKSPTIRIDIRR